jgi:hypothetical protein
MKTAIVIGLICGFAGVLAASHFYPWVAHARLPSQTSVVANGGRAERFLIRLPVDRIASAGGAETGLRGSPTFPNMSLPAELARESLLIEHFKVRDSAGNVIGIAARHWSATPDGPGTAWSLMIPSRGALMLVAPGEPRAALDAALRRAGYRPGSSWDGNVEVELGRDDAGKVAAGSDEFEGLDGEYSETWNVTGISDTGEVRGTIEIDTVTFRGA